MKSLSLPLLISAIVSAPSFATELEEVYVTSDFSLTALASIPEATSIVDEALIQARSAEHLEQVLSFAPNVNFSSGSSRGRYFQIRGIGERSQFVDPVNPSVGLVIDNIDMTGLGGAATLFDVQQVEVLRGPQGTRFGANSLAGIVNIKSNDPSEAFEAKVSARAGNYNTFGLGGFVSGPFSDNVRGRVAINSFQSDGYIDNTFLDREDTNDLDEIIARGKLHFQFSESTSLGLTYLHANIDNGYDAFSLDNNRNTLSDEPGKDAQDTDALALDFNAELNDAIHLKVILTASESDVEYSYDEDWTFVGIAPGWEYSSFDQYLRDFERQSLDLRLSSGESGRIFGDSTDWVVGIHTLNRDEQLIRNYTFAAQFTSDLDVSSSALYGEFTTQLSDSMRLIYGLRLENWENTYSDNNGVAGETDEDLVGGKITLEATLSDQHLSYVSLARGYKAGGVNSDPDVSAVNREFDTEFNNVIELGLKSQWSGSFYTAINLFHIERKDQQVKSSYAVQNEETNAFSFQEFLSNAAEGRNSGIEIEGTWDINDFVSWDLSYGYLFTEFSDYSFETDEGIFNISGREQAHAPNFSAATALSFNFTDALSLRVEAEAKDEFYFSDSHDLESDSYNLLHARIAYETDQFSVALFGRNLTDKEYATRGFGFPNDPRDEYTSIGYIQLGEPRTFGISGSVNF